MYINGLNEYNALIEKVLVDDIIEKEVIEYKAKEFLKHISKKDLIVYIISAEKDRFELEDKRKQLEFYKDQNKMHCDKYYEELEVSDKLYKETLNQAKIIKELRNNLANVKNRLNEKLEFCKGDGII